MIRIFMVILALFVSSQSANAKWFSEPEEIFETERCLGAFIKGIFTNLN